MKKKTAKKAKLLLLSIVSIFVLINIIAATQAYKFTHFRLDVPEVAREQGLNIPFTEKIKVGLFGLDMGKPKARELPNRAYENILIPINDKDILAAWKMKTDSVSKGIVLLFHGYMDEKSSMLDRSYILLDMGYDVLLTDFTGAGCSSGLQTTIGNNEAKEVKVVYDYTTQNIQKENIHLLGFSMGAVAVIKAQNDYQMNVRSLIVETPYATFEGSIKKRFDLVGVPHFPMAQLMIFWGGVENDFDPYEMRPIDFAKNITVPVLEMSGELDENISVEEAESIYNNFASGKKQLQLFPLSVHESYVSKYPIEWRNVVSDFLSF